jgi:hypothetical protein
MEQMPYENQQPYRNFLFRMYQALWVGCGIYPPDCLKMIGNFSRACRWVKSTSLRVIFEENGNATYLP